MDRRRRTDLEGAQALGRFSDQMVFSIGRTLREGSVQQDDIRSFRSAADLFELLARDDVGVPDTVETMTFSAGGYLDALRAVQDHAEEGQLEDYAARMESLLRTVADRAEVLQEERDELESLRDLFAEVGEVTLSRAGELSLPQEAHWPQLRQVI